MSAWNQTIRPWKSDSVASWVKLGQIRGIPSADQNQESTEGKKKKEKLLHLVNLSQFKVESNRCMAALQSVTE